jgi:hypothetical protein
LIGALLAPLLMLGACSTPEQMTRAGLISAGVPRPMAGCMAHRMVERLSLLQLKRLAGLGKGEHLKSVSQFLHRVRSLNDPKIVGVTTSSAALCALGVG